MSEKPCSVCAEAVEPHTESYCNGCGRLFHLNQRSDRPGRDCGTVALSEAHLALEFLCAACAEAADAPAELAAVLDLAEAARAAGMGEAALAAEAAAGRIPHRRTAGGALLFKRTAVERLARAGGGAVWDSGGGREHA